MPITPADGPSAPAQYAAVPESQFNIQAPMPDVQSAFDAANAAAGAGVLYGMSDRQRETRAILESPQGAGLDGLDVMSGTTVGWPANVEPGG